MYPLEATFPIVIIEHIWKLVTMLVLIISPMGLEMGYIGQKLGHLVKL